MNRHSIRAAAVLAIGASTAPAQVTIEWVTVGNAGNAPDLRDGDASTPGFQSVGAVGYEYRIGRYEVTNAQYAAFLNAVAASDPNGLYDTRMATNRRGGIARVGAPASYTYVVKTNMGNKPVNYVDWYDAARMANWMTNGQGSASTETGVYTFDGVDSVSNITRDISNSYQVFIPTEDEWYKAAHYQPASEGGDDDDYWLYATGSNVIPTVASATSIGDVFNPGPTVVNFDQGADWGRENGNVTTVGSAGSKSFYGAFDMNGNVHEWNETQIDAARIARGGSWIGGLQFLPSSSRSHTSPTLAGNGLGFRLASPVARTCSPADLAEAFNTLDINDILAFAAAFDAAEPAADLTGEGDIDINDILTFADAFDAGCP